MKLEQAVIFSGKIYCVSGLSIGGSSITLDIGGIDREVIKNPITKEPYIPGSSLKGKMRSELEKKYGTKCWIKESQKSNKEVLKRKKDKILVVGDKEPCGCGEKSCLICMIFGSHKNPGADSAPTRIIVRDAVLSKEKMEKNSVILERKTENIVSRTSDTADSPRIIERVPAGTYFDFEIVLRIFEGDNKQHLIDKVVESLKLVQESYLGGCGSRGSGSVTFEYEIQDEKKPTVQMSV
jgi:CRISPR type III-A/MTUBE-associated RAMP protein Csm3